MDDVLEALENTAAIMEAAKTDIQEENPRMAIYRILEQIEALSNNFLREPANSEAVETYHYLVWFLFRFYYEYGLNNCKN